MSSYPYIVSDLDGVLIDLVSEACYWFWQRFRVVVPPMAISTFEITDSIYELIREKNIEVSKASPPYTKEAFQDEVKRKLWQDPAVYMRAKPHFAIWRAFLEWPGHLSFATNRPQSWGIRKTTQDWLALHGFGEELHEINFCHADYAKKDVVSFLRECLIADYAKKDVVSFLRECLINDGRGERTGRIIFIEDNQAEAEQVHQTFPDIDVILVERPWVTLKAVPMSKCVTMSKLQVMSEEDLCLCLKGMREGASR